MESFGMLLLACVLILAIIPFIAELSEMKKGDLKPMKEPVKGKTKKLSKKYIKVIYDNRYIQYQKLIDGKWVLHNLNGPAVIDSVNEKTAYFINGIEYTNELQYLVAKGDYENKEEL